MNANARVFLALALLSLIVAACGAPSESGGEASADDAGAAEEAEEPAGEQSDEPAAEEESGEPAAEAEAGEAGEASQEETGEPAEEEAAEPEGPTFEYDPEALAVIAELNQWRLVEGLWPFKPNETLTELALEQAEYVNAQPSFPTDVHAGPDGSKPKDRALAAGWPHYSNEDQIAITEITVVATDPVGAINWWNGSPVHHDSVVDPAYREIGVAALEHPWGYLYVAVLGGRPDVLPALVEPDSGRLHFSAERYRWAGSGGDWLIDAKEIQVLDSAEAEPDPAAWLPWQYSINVPDVGGGAFNVAYTDGSRVTTAEVQPGFDTLWLPGNLPQEEEEVVEVAEAAEEAAASDDAGTGGAETPSESEGAATPAAGGSDLTFVYKDISFALLNTSSEPLDLTGLEFVGESVTTSVTRWDTAALSGPLDAFPVGDCMMFIDWSSRDLGPPSGCRFRLSAVFISPDEIFWTEGKFEVRLGGELLATCDAGAERCEADLP